MGGPCASLSHVVVRAAPERGVLCVRAECTRAGPRAFHAFPRVRGGVFAPRFGRESGCGGWMACGAPAVVGRGGEGGQWAVSWSAGDGPSRRPGQWIGARAPFRPCRRHWSAFSVWSAGALPCHRACGAGLRVSDARIHPEAVPCHTLVCGRSIPCIPSSTHFKGPQRPQSRP